MKEINLSEIKINNKYLRVDTNIDDLVKSIEKVGLINPLTINEKNELLAGGRRYSALKELNIETVKVLVVKLNNLEQELISIDENLVRKELNKIEFENCLNRGREIYEQLNPELEKVCLEVKNLTPSEKKLEKEKELKDETSFVAVTSEKTGLSKGVIKSAIQRDALSSDLVKNARNMGELSATQTNELIKLQKEQQDEILEVIYNKPGKDIKKIVENVKKVGVQEAIKIAHNIETIPVEYKNIQLMAKKFKKLLSKVIVENIEYDGIEKEKIVKDLNIIKEHIGNIGNTNNDLNIEPSLLVNSENTETESSTQVH